MVVNGVIGAKGGDFHDYIMTDGDIVNGKDGRARLCSSKASQDGHDTEGIAGIVDGSVTIETGRNLDTGGICRFLQFPIRCARRTNARIFNASRHGIIVHCHCATSAHANGHEFAIHVRAIKWINARPISNVPRVWINIVLFNSRRCCRGRLFVVVVVHLLFHLMLLLLFGHLSTRKRNNPPSERGSGVKL